MARKSYWAAMGKAMTGLMLVSVLSCAASVHGPAQAARTEREATSASELFRPQARPDEMPSAPAANPDRAEVSKSEATSPTDAADSTAAAPESDKPESASQPTRLRRLRGRELTPAMVKHARAIIKQHNREPVGTEIPFEVEGSQYVGRIERHFHPIGGEARPWGWHPGCSLFAVEGAS